MDCYCHPGGDLRLFFGQDVTENFNKAGHYNDSYELMLTYKIGILKC